MSNVETAVGILAIALIFVAAYLSLAESSLSRVDRYRAQQLVEEKRKRSAALLHIVGDQSKFSGYLNSISLLLLATQMIASTAIAYLALRWFSAPWVILVVVLEIAIGYVIAEAMPKTWAIQHPERSALFVAPLIATLLRGPVRWISRPLIWVTNLLLPGKGLREGPFVYGQQILALADNAAESNQIERDEHRLITSVIQFGSTVAREVMVPRTDMITLPANLTATAAIDLAIANGYSRMPVHGEDSDDIIGTLFTKDLLRVYHSGSGDVLISTLVRPVKFIPETKKVAELMSEMQQEKVHMTIVVDEYGTVVGLVTLEDLIEEVVGEIVDEYDVEELPQFEQVSDDEWRIDARMPIDEVFEELAIKLPHGDWDTVGGLLINAFGRVPNRGESTTVDNYFISVEATSGRRVTRALIKVLPVVEDAESKAEEAS